MKYGRYFRLSPTYALVPRQDIDFDVQGLLSTAVSTGSGIYNLGNTLVNPLGREFGLVLGSSGLHHYFGARLMYVMGINQSILIETRNDTVYQANYERIGGPGWYLDYSYTFNLLGRYITLEPGLSAGYSTLKSSWRNDTTATTTTLDYVMHNWGGPRLALNAGLPRIKVGCEYALGITYLTVAIPDGLSGVSPGKKWFATGRWRFSLIFDI